MVLYTCKFAKGPIPDPLHAHGCANAVKALDQAGYRYEHRPVGGFRLLPFTLKSSRAEVRELSGQNLVPVLVLDDDVVIHGSKAIVAWVKANPSPAAA